MAYDAIPMELRALNQWVCWRYVANDATKMPTKIPFDPRIAQYASVTDPTTWVSFDVAVEAAQRQSYNGIGFVFTDQDPYAGIDLDKIMSQSIEIQNLHRQVFEKFDSYSEWSPSGEGLHIIVKGAVRVGRNNREKKIETYSSGRWFTFTGDVANEKPIEERNDLLQLLWADLGGKEETESVNIAAFERPQSKDDAAVYDIAMNAENGAKFCRLWNGEWQGEYPSQSEADMALVDILQYYSKNTDQITRMFLMSGLGQRDKARKRKNYVPTMVARAFDRETHMIDFSEIDNKQLSFQKVEPDVIEAESVASVVEVIEPVNAVSKFAPKNDPLQTDSPFSVPSGLLGEIARFVYSASPRPVAEASLSAAIIMLAGIVGKAYNVSSTGLNQYVLYLAPTASGKEAIASGINKLMNHLCYGVPAASGFQGPSDFASGQGLMRMISNSETKGSMFSIIGEFGLRMQNMSTDRATPSEKELQRNLLDLYMKSGKNDVYKGSAYAQKENNIKSIAAPAFSILGEGVPTSFYNTLDEKTVVSGLLPRFTIIEYTGPRVAENKFHAQAKPNDMLLRWLSDVAATSLGRIAHNQVCDVQLDHEAYLIDDEFNNECDRRINGSFRDVIKGLWSRARVKVLKLAALVAVGENHTSPVINRSNYEWAKGIVVYETKMIVGKFLNGALVGDIDNLEHEQALAILRLIDKWANLTYPYMRNVRHSHRMHRDQVFVISDIQQRMAMLSVFRRDTRKDMRQKMERALETLKSAGVLIEVNYSNPDVILKNYGMKARSIRVADYGMMMAYMNGSASD
jgi:hypothetical protein